MVPISSRGDYGLLFVAFLAGQNRVVSVRQISTKLNLPYRYLGRIARELKKAGLVTTREGRGGGYLLARPPAEITVREVLQSLEGKATVRCHLGKHCPAADTCLVRKTWRVIGAQVDQVMEGVTLADINR